jgi:hypothetical protein
MRLRNVLLGAVCCLAVPSVRAEDSFGRIKKHLAEAACCRFEFLNLLSSEVFDRVDSVFGTAAMARDGRYRVTVNSDSYLYDNTNVYSYSAANNQLVIERPGPGSVNSDQISFVTRLDEWYRTFTVKSDSLYRLVRKDKVAGDVPDSMLVRIDPVHDRIREIQFYDVNDDLNRVIILKQNTDPQCDERRFVPDFPDSVETIRL